MEAPGLPLTPGTLAQGALFCIQFQGGCGRQSGPRLRSPPSPNSGDGEAWRGGKRGFLTSHGVQGRHRRGGMETQAARGLGKKHLEGKNGGTEPKAS